MYIPIQTGIKAKEMKINLETNKCYVWIAYLNVFSYPLRLESKVNQLWLKVIGPKR